MTRSSAENSASVIVPSVVSHGSTSATTSSISSSVVAAALTARWWTRKKSSARCRSVRAIRSSHRLSWSPSRARVSSSSSSSWSASRRRGEPEPLGVEHGAHEERPLGEHVGDRLADEHPLGVEAVRAAGRRGVGEHVRLAAHPGRGVGEVDDVERAGAEHPLPERQGGVAARAVAVPAVSVLPREAPAGDGDRPGRGLHHEVEGQVGGVGRREPLDDVGGQQLGGAPARAQRHVGARLVARPRGGRHGIRAVVAPHPLPRALAAGAARRHGDLVGDEEARQQADAELAEEALPGQAEGVTLGRGPDRREHGPDAVLVEADAGVLDVQPAVGRDVGRDHADAARRPGVLLRALGDRVDGVLEQLAQVDPGAGVQVVRQEVDDAAEVDVEG